MTKQSELCPFGDDLQDYWDLRHDLFSKFDQGIQITREGLFSVKPEQSALRIARALRGDAVLDAFCGMGGNAIAFAREGKRVFAVDINPEHLEMAQNNARVYGVRDKITFLRGDVLEIMASLNVESIYLDPPWTGPHYKELEYFKFENFDPDGFELLKKCMRHAQYVVITVPPNFDLRELGRVDRNFTFERDYLRDKLLYFNVYFDNVYFGNVYFDKI
jgi:trimethylguanosine synthase